jgi:hypothetical protein
VKTIARSIRVSMSSRPRIPVSGLPRDGRRVSLRQRAKRCVGLFEDRSDEDSRRFQYSSWRSIWYSGAAAAFARPPDRRLISLGSALRPA